MADKKAIAKSTINSKCVKDNGDPELIVDSKPDVLIIKSQSSVEISRDAKGTMKYTIKVYDNDPFTALNKALQVREELENRNGDDD